MFTLRNANIYVHVSAKFKTYSDADYLTSRKGELELCGMFDKFWCK